LVCNVARTHCLARAVEADDNDGKLVFPVNLSIGIEANEDVSVFQT
jgi:hypothetical protein